MCSRASRTAAPLAVLVALVALIGPGPSYSAIAPQRLVEVADISGLAVSPDGRTLAFRLEHASVERNAWQSAWYVQDMEGHLPPRRVGDGGEPLHDIAGTTVPGQAQWSPDG